MSFTFDDAIQAARDRHPAFHRSRVPGGPLARFATDQQNELIQRCVRRDPQFLSQKASILFSVDTLNAVGTAGAGTTGGLPGETDANGAFSVVEESSGSLIEASTTSDDGATVHVSERPVTSATSTTLTCSTVARTVNGDVDRVLVITGGTGQGQRRSVISNTATVWTVAAWTTTPDSTSLFTLVEPVFTSSGALGVVTTLPSVSTQTGYLVKTDAQGVPYLDYTTPLVATVADGLSLPSMHALLGGRVRMTDGDAVQLTVVSQDQQDNPPNWPAVYTVGQQVFVIGAAEDWTDVNSLELDYVPVAPPFTALTDTYLLPDSARACVVAGLAAFMAIRVAGMPEVSIDPNAFASYAVGCERQYLTSLLITRQRRIERISEAW